jgi:diguanylate cyclase (GGDEF)-like protein
VITRDEAGRIRDKLLEVLREDAHNSRRLLSRLDALSRESGIGAHSAILLILTQLGFEEGEARAHWEKVLRHRESMAQTLGRDVGVRVALLDYFTNVNRHLTQPSIIDLEMYDVTERSCPSDPLTGLLNDRAFHSAVQTELRRARRYAQSVAIVVFDLDDFAAVNERHDRIVGDRLLRETALLLNNKIRDIDLAARPGEDELALVLAETDRNGALVVAERFRLEVEAHFRRREVGGETPGLTVSGGVASYPEDATTGDGLLERAAQALYHAKAYGKNRVQTYHPERRRFLRFELEPGRFEVEVLAPRSFEPGEAGNLSRNGIVFTCPELLEVGEEIEIRLSGQDGAPASGLRLRGRVVRLEELPAPDREPGATATQTDRFEVGVAFVEDGSGPADRLVEFVEHARMRTPPHTS